MTALSRREVATRPADKIRAVVRRDACPRARPPIKSTQHEASLHWGQTVRSDASP
jgi:hypothetical protein